MLKLFPWLWICNFYFLIYQGSPEETKPVQMDSRRSPEKTNEQVLSICLFELVNLFTFSMQFNGTPFCSIYDEEICPICLYQIMQFTLIEQIMQKLTI